ncbi:MAG: two-component regulator propeller domain-containing protein, partial [Candidatus Promineifilaceae bacterium]
IYLAISVYLVSCGGNDSTPPSDEAATPGFQLNSEDPSGNVRSGVTPAPVIAVFRSPLMSTDSINFEHISIEEGLSQSSVHAILQDRDGFMWFGTLDGLNRFDGSEINIYKHDPDDPSSISDNMITSLFEDDEGVLWIGTSAGGLNRYDRDNESFSSYRHDPQSANSLSSSSILSISEDSKGDLWIGTDGGGLNRLDRSTGEITRYQNDPTDPNSIGNNTVHAIYEDSHGNLWIATDGDGLNLFDSESEEFSSFRKEIGNPRSLINDYVVSIAEDRDGHLWIGTRGGTLHRFDPDHGLFYRYQSGSIDPDSLVDYAVTGIVEDQTGRIWVATNGGGVMLFDQQSGQFNDFQNSLTDPNSLSSNNVRAIFEDRAGVLWLGTDGGGVNKFSSSSMRFQHIQNDPDDPYSLSSNDVLAIMEDRDGDLWVGTLGGGLNRLGIKEGRLTRFSHEPRNPDSLSSNIVFSIIQDRNGDYWIGTSSGLDRFDATRGTFEHFQNEPNDSNTLSHNVVLSLLEDGSGGIWIGTSGGLNRYDPITGRFTRYLNDSQNSKSISKGSVRAIHDDGEGAFWIATDNGLDKYDAKSGEFIHFTNNPGDPNSLSDNRVLSIYPGDGEELWIGTYGGGLNRFDTETGTFSSYREKDGLPNDAILCIQEDERENLWLSTIKGLSRFDPETGQFRNYDVRDGLQSNEFNANSCFTGANSKMYFGGINGFNAFYPGSITDNPYVPPIVLTELTQGGEPVAVSQNEEGQDTVAFYWPNDFFEFEFSALSYSQSDKNQYAYRLEGYDEEWNYLGTKHSGRYLNLPAGEYTLRLIGSNNDGSWNEEGITLNVTVVPPFWQTTWFRILVVMIVVGSVAIGYRLRLRGIETRTRDLETQVEERTHDLEARTLELERRKNAAEGLREILLIINSDRSLEESLNYIVDQVAGLTGADEVAIIKQEVDGEAILIASNLPGAELNDNRLLEAQVEQVLSGKTIMIPEKIAGSDPDVPVFDMSGYDHHSILGLPLSVGNEPYGGLILYFGEERKFTEEDLELSSTFADQAMLAIGNAQLRDQAEQNAVAMERSRLARDLHDAVTQTLFSASLIAEVMPATWENDHEEGRTLLRELRQLSRGALAEMRTLLLELRPATLVDAKLADLLNQLTDSLTGRTGIPVELTIESHCPLPADVHVSLYRIAQEALNNVVKHADASQVTVSLKCVHPTEAADGTGKVTLIVSDNGQGFDPDCVAADCLGLNIMRERAQAAGADLSVYSMPGEGTTVTVHWEQESETGASPASLEEHKKSSSLPV